jgi:probable F420-dependent oxidoreductase
MATASGIKFFVEYPILSDVEDGAWANPANIAEFARVGEASGLDALAFTDHPAPSKKWLLGGGHETFDPFVALGYVAGVTSTLRLMTYLTVVPYRNPLLTAKSMTAVDVLSGGRSIYVLGTGYLRSEFAALGVDFAERNELFDEAVEVMRGMWSTDDFHFSGRHFDALGVTMKPGPVQKPHPPLWLGGNSSVVRDRVAAWGQGWAPLLGGGPALTRTTRTRAIATDADFARLITEIGDKMEAAGRDRTALEVAGRSLTPLPEDASPEQQVDALGSLTEVGVTWTPFPLDRSSFPAALDGLRRYGAEVVAKIR